MIRLRPENGRTLERGDVFQVRRGARRRRLYKVHQVHEDGTVTARRYFWWLAPLMLYVAVLGGLTLLERLLRPVFPWSLLFFR